MALPYVVIPFSIQNRWKFRKAAPGSRYQFERLEYFCVDPDAAKGKPVFNRTVTLRDEWSKIEKGGKGHK